MQYSTDYWRSCTKVVSPQESASTAMSNKSHVSSFSSWFAGPRYTVQHLAITCRCASSWWSQAQLCLRWPTVTCRRLQTSARKWRKVIHSAPSSYMVSDDNWVLEHARDSPGIFQYVFGWGVVSCTLKLCAHASGSSWKERGFSQLLFAEGGPSRLTSWYSTCREDLSNKRFLYIKSLEMS